MERKESTKEEPQFRRMADVVDWSDEATQAQNKSDVQNSNIFFEHQALFEDQSMISDRSISLDISKLIAVIKVQKDHIEALESK